jgi:hypothetical protein
MMYMHRIVRTRCLHNEQAAVDAIVCIALPRVTAGSLQELADMEYFPGWDEYFQHPESLSMPPGGLLPEEEANNKTANPYDSKDPTSIQCRAPAGLSPDGPAVHDMQQSAK